jgi:ketosteroid isomerase-like protein
MASNLQTVKNVYAAFAQGDVPAILAAMHERIEWHEPESLPYQNQIGPQAIAENVFGRVFQDVTGFTIAAEEFIDGGDTIVTIGRYRGRGSQTGIAIDTPFVHIWRVRDGKLSYFRTYTDTKHWLDALGARGLQ